MSIILIYFIAERVNKPKSLTETGIPGIMNIFQTEWDSIILETYTLRKNLETVKNQLSHALYQKEAACRVIARIKQERDEARQALAMTQEQLADFKSNSHLAASHLIDNSDNKENIDSRYEQENSGIYPELATQMDELSNELYSERKKDKKPKDYYKPADFESVTESGIYPLHSSITPGILCLDVHSKH